MKMLLTHLLVPMAALALLVAPAHAQDAAPKNNGAKLVAGPKGGRLLGQSAPRAEFLLEKDHRASIRFYDDALKPLPLGDQQGAVLVETKQGRKKLNLEKRGDALVSAEPLPAGDGYNVIVQLKENIKAKPENHRFKLETYICEGCKLAEYACICDE